jgi:hypothetical protein
VLVGNFFQADIHSPIAGFFPDTEPLDQYRTASSAAISALLLLSASQSAEKLTIRIAIRIRASLQRCRLRCKIVAGFTGCGKTHDSYQAMPSGIA